MTARCLNPRRGLGWWRPTFLALAILGGCGGGNPLGNGDDISNAEATGGQKLAFAYFQRCVQPVLLANIAGNTCASGGCHDNSSGTGGALRVIGSASLVDLSDSSNTADLIRLTEMYRNYYSSQGVTLPGSPSASLLLNKPLVRGVLHGGGVIFSSEDEALAKVLRYWINHPAPKGHDEFSSATWTMFSPADPTTGTCLTE